MCQPPDYTSAVAAPICSRLSCSGRVAAPSGVHARRRITGPRGVLILAALAIEGVALALWPATYFLDSTEFPSRVGEMFQSRFGIVRPILSTLKTAVDWVVPGALWSWPNLVAFTFEAVLVAFFAYALAAWRLTAVSPDGNRPRGGRSPANKSLLPWIVAPLLLFQITLVLIPATMSTDIFNYALYGEMPVLYDANPFVHTAAEFPQSPLFYLIPLYWHDAPSVYGPFWVALSMGVASTFRSSPLAEELLAYRLIANGAHFCNTLLIWALARRIHPGRESSAALAYGWNPLLLVDFAMNGHNDALMLSFVLGAFLLAAYGRMRASALMLGISIACKFTSVLIAPVLMLWAVTWGVGTRLRIWPIERSRLIRIGLALLLWGALTGLSAAVWYLPWIQGEDPLGPVKYWVTGPRLHNFWPEPALITLTSWISGPLGADYEETWRWVFDGFKLLGKIGLALYICFEAIRARTLDDVLAASARITLAFLLLVNTWVLSWYYSWPLALCAALGWRSRTVRVAAGFTLTALVLTYQNQYSETFVADWGGIMMIMPLLLAIAPGMATRLRALAFSTKSDPSPSMPGQGFASAEEMRGMDTSQR
ncbi:MAG: hypothetical protein HW416_763 [Chloroflexi bacterium]|nr:hypothetical protein [Chloroflexota bacterium]